MRKRRNLILVLFILVGIATPIEPVWAKGEALAINKNLLFYFGGDLALTSTAADQLSGVSLTKNMRTPLIAVAGVGAYILKPLWVGVRYEYWFTGREWSSLGITQKETLNLQMVGPEIAYVRGNPRVSYHFAFGGMYPLVQRVSSSVNGNYNRGSQFWNTHARVSMELKFNSYVGLHLETGYRWLNLRDLQSSGNSFIQSGGDLNLSGPFVGGGLCLWF